MRALIVPREDPDGMTSILRDVRVLARRGSFCVAARRFGDLRLEDGRHQQLERSALETLEPGMESEDRAMLEQLTASRDRMLQLEDSCAAALQRCAEAEYEAAADALEGELRTHAALERQLTRRLHGLLWRPADQPRGDLRR